MEEHNQSSLLKSKRFLPFFCTQFLGAFNDNIFKNTLMLLIAFSATRALGLESNVVMNLAAGLFILPFFLFSSIAGQVADKYEKSSIIRRVKLAEIFIMLLAAASFVTESYSLLLLLLFVMGTQSTFFGPVKYAILPQHLSDDELVGGNALVEMGTFVAILLGTIGAGLLMGVEDTKELTAVAVVAIAIAGYLASRKIPKAEPADPSMKLDFNIVRMTGKVLKYAREDRAVYLSIMAISWFWFLGASYLTQFPNFAKTVLQGDSSVVTMLLALFSIGIGVGSMLCERLSGHKVEIGIVPIGSLGLTLFGIDLYASIPSYDVDQPLTWLQFIAHPESVRVLIDLAGIGIFGGFFIVPLYAYIQKNSRPERRAQIIAANNIMNALFMVGSAIAGIVLLGVLELSIPQFFLVIALMNLVIAIYVYTQVPEFAFRFVVWILSHSMYRVTHKDLDVIPDEGPAVIVCNHVSFVDALLIAGAIRRPIRFVMDYQIFKSTLLGPIFRLAKAIPIAPRHKDEEVYQQAFDSISKELEQGQLVCIFPEGKLTKTGDINEFRGGVEIILERNSVDVVTIALQGLWGSFFSHKDGPAFSGRPKRFWSKVNIVGGRKWQAKDVTAAGLELEVRELRGDNP
ncbi:MFS transporter [Alkalimarinus sediminis]|uniref:MFS transporter n=1 Tax=Alkalimarinus sediminis TaxID=1632866 RepID=A0A9E8KPR9_9ALTE|nr:MFS transporter [Alkalimarinus sediminis]UZW75019.1 MFS transporter [Alkalimarinus sediminis]